MSSVDTIITAWKKKDFAPIYWIEGEEDFFIDKITHYAEHQILTEAEAGFNLTVFYGKDAVWTDIVNACMRYPMFADKQVVLLKEAQHLKDIEKLVGYVSQPLASTIFVVGYKEKKLDGRGSLAKMLKKNAVVVETKKLYENELPDWTQKMIQGMGLGIEPKALALLVDHIGNDLSRLHTEIEKIQVNLQQRKTITAIDIEQFVGVSREFNAFELQTAMAEQQLPKVLRIIQYFENNPKAVPIQLVLPTLYGFFAKLQMVHTLSNKTSRSIQEALRVNGFAARDLEKGAKNYNLSSVEKSLLLLAEYNLKTVGMNQVAQSDADILKELVVKIMAG
jgi:DNA polymerase III subunit delta